MYVHNYTNITTHSEYPIIWHDSGMSPPQPQLKLGRAQTEMWKLAKAWQNIRFGMEIILTPWVILCHSIHQQIGHYTQGCVREPYVLMIGTKTINQTERNLTSQDCKLHTWLNSSLFNSNHSMWFCINVQEFGCQYLKIGLGNSPLTCILCSQY